MILTCNSAVEDMNDIDKSQTRDITFNTDKPRDITFNTDLQIC